MAEDPRSPQLTYPLEADVMVPAQWDTPRPALAESERRLRVAVASADFGWIQLGQNGAGFHSVAGVGGEALNDS